jgi:hypothetical protein
MRLILPENEMGNRNPNSTWHIGSMGVIYIPFEHCPDGAMSVWEKDTQLVFLWFSGKVSFI